MPVATIMPSPALTRDSVDIRPLKAHQSIQKCRTGACEASACRCPSLPRMESTASQVTLVNEEPMKAERLLGDTEASYFLPSRESGVNDMYLHLGCHAPVSIFSHERIRLVWAILRVRHPLLGARVEMHSYDDLRYAVTQLLTPEAALANADENLEFRTQTKDELLDSYLNGPRTLSANRISYLIISRAPSSASGDLADFEVLICAAHFLGDGMALHQFANDFFGLLGGQSSLEGLHDVLSAEVYAQCGKFKDQLIQLPASLEDRLPEVKGRFRDAVNRVDFQRDQEKLIGGQSFPRDNLGSRHTIVPTVPIDEQRTKAILKRCKENGVSISAALFAICNIAWARTSGDKPELPSMMYSALNLRPYLLADKALHDSYWFLAIGYFNVILPSFLPKSGDITKTFWHRARSAKVQSTKAAKNPMTISRSMLMARERGKRARIWAKEDDDKANGVWVPPPPKPKPTQPSNKAPSSALIGLSLLGNLDGIYKHATFGDIKLHTLTTGSRQRAGAMLLFGYTFAGKLWISLGYDENGFKKGVVEKFWENVLSCTQEFLVD